MAIETEFSVAVNGDIRYTGTAHGVAGATYWTVIELHRFLQDLADDASSSGNDLLDITDDTPSDRSTDNIITLNGIYNIDDVASEHLYDGSIIQTGGAEIYDGIVNFGSEGVPLDIIQNGAIVAGAQVTLGTDPIATTSASTAIIVAHTAHGFLAGQEVTLSGAVCATLVDSEVNKTHVITSVTANTFTLTVTTAATATDALDGGAAVDDRRVVFWNFIPDGETVRGLNRLTANGISHRFLIKTRTGGADIDGRRVIGINRGFSKTYGEFSINGTARGNNVLALTEASDLNNATAEDTVGAISDILNVTEGYANLDVDNAGGDEFYYSEWDKGANSINTFYEYTKHVSRRGSSALVYGLPGELFRGITHQFATTGGGQSVTDFAAFEALSWGTGATAGTAQLLAVDDVNAAGTMWVQLLTGVLPTGTELLTGGTSGATVSLATTVTSRTISRPFIGASTGTSIIGAYGVGIEVLDLTASDKLFDLTNSQKVPPNNVTFTVSGLVSTEDRVLVGPESGGVIDVAQLGQNAAVAGATTTSLVMDSVIPTDTPASGTIRCLNTEGLYVRVVYSSYTGSTFTITSTDFSGTGQNADLAINANVFISYIDTLAGAATATFTGVYSADRSLFIRVRDGGAASPIKTFETTGTLGSAGGTSTAIRTADL